MKIIIRIEKNQQQQRHNIPCRISSRSLLKNEKRTKTKQINFYFPNNSVKEIFIFITIIYLLRENKNENEL